MGYSSDELMGKNPQMIYADPADYLRMGRVLYHLDANIENHIFEMSYRRKDGSVFLAESWEPRFGMKAERFWGF